MKLLSDREIGLMNATETARSNRAREAEMQRANMASEAEAFRSHFASEVETARSNLAREREIGRHNVATEWIYYDPGVMSTQLQLMQLREAERHNRASEMYSQSSIGLGYANLSESSRAALAREEENYRHNVAVESEAIRSNKASEKVSRGHLSVDQRRQQMEEDFQIYRKINSVADTVSKGGAAFKNIATGVVDIVGAIATGGASAAVPSGSNSDISTIANQWNEGAY